MQSMASPKCREEGQQSQGQRDGPGEACTPLLSRKGATAL